VLLLLPVQRREASGERPPGAGLGLLVIRRNNAPHTGKLALPGGYIEIHETWQAAAARELYEEAGIRIPEGSVREFRVRSTDGGLILIFGQASPIHEDALPPFAANHEVSAGLFFQPAARSSRPALSETCDRHASTPPSRSPIPSRTA
jgi:ADP-ribose pyrophosphatase YjhB (NUDIX family)